MLRVFCAFLLLLLSAVSGMAYDAMVTGGVLCEPCKDGFYRHPVPGARVRVSCHGGARKEATTDVSGMYAIRFENSPALSRCSVRVVKAPEDCRRAVGPAHELRLMAQMPDLETYAVDPLVLQPRKPRSTCPPLAKALPPRTSPYRPAACPYSKWVMPENRRYWRIVTPDTKVAAVFGPEAAEQYGLEMTLMEGLRGGGEPYIVLRREAITAYLNAQNSFRFKFSTMDVEKLFKMALNGSRKEVLRIAHRFRKANSGVFGSGFGAIGCNFAPS